MKQLSLVLLLIALPVNHCLPKKSGVFACDAIKGTTLVEAPTRRARTEHPVITHLKKHRAAYMALGAAGLTVAAAVARQLMQSPQAQTPPQSETALIVHPQAAQLCARITNAAISDALRGSRVSASADQRLLRELFKRAYGESPQPQRQAPATTPVVHNQATSRVTRLALCNGSVDATPAPTSAEIASAATARRREALARAPEPRALLAAAANQQAQVVPAARAQPQPVVHARGASEATPQLAAFQRLLSDLQAIAEEPAQAQTALILHSLATTAQVEQTPAGVSSIAPKTGAQSAILAPANHAEVEAELTAIAGINQAAMNNKMSILDNALNSGVINSAQHRALRFSLYEGALEKRFSHINAVVADPAERCEQMRSLSKLYFEHGYISHERFNHLQIQITTAETMLHQAAQTETAMVPYQPVAEPRVPACPRRALQWARRYVAQLAATQQQTHATTDDASAVVVHNAPGVAATPTRGIIASLLQPYKALFKQPRAAVTTQAAAGNLICDPKLASALRSPRKAFLAPVERPLTYVPSSGDLEPLHLAYEMVPATSLVEAPYVITAADIEAIKEIIGSARTAKPGARAQEPQTPERRPRQAMVTTDGDAESTPQAVITSPEQPLVANINPRAIAEATEAAPSTYAAVEAAFNAITGTAAEDYAHRSSLLTRAWRDAVISAEEQQTLWDDFAAQQEPSHLPLLEAQLEGITRTKASPIKQAELKAQAIGRAAALNLITAATHGRLQGKIQAEGKTFQVAQINAACDRISPATDAAEARRQRREIIDAACGDYKIDNATYGELLLREDHAAIDALQHACAGKNQAEKLLLIKAAYARNEISHTTYVTLVLGR